MLYLLTPLTYDTEEPVEKWLPPYLAGGWYVLRDRAAGLDELSPGDRICFYEAGVGVVAEVEVDSKPVPNTSPRLADPEKWPWAFKVKNPRLFLTIPVVIDAALRAQLDAFQGRDPHALGHGLCGQPAR